MSETAAGPGSLRARLYRGFRIATAIALVAAVVAVGMLFRTENRLERSLVASEQLDQLLSRYTAAVMQEIVVGQRHLLTGEPDDARAFEELGFVILSLEQESLARIATSARESGIVGSVRESQAIMEAILARAHRLMELGRTAEAREAQERLRPHIMLVEELLTELAEHRGRTRIAVVRAALTDARWGALMAMAALFLAFLVAFATALDNLRSVAGALTPVSVQVAELATGHSEARMRPEELPVEFRELAVALNDAGRSLEELREVERLSTVGSLVSGVAHELNNPLAAILLRAEELAEKAGSDGAREIGREIREEALRARDVVRRLLAVGRESTGGSTAPGPVLLGVADAARERAPGEGVEFSAHVSDGLPDVPVTSVTLQRVAEELLDNAFEAVGLRGGRVRMTASADSAEGPVRVAVEDNGPGIPMHLRSRVLDPFFTNRADAGHRGLGLSVVQGRIETAGGKVRISTSQREGGACVEVELPAAARAHERGDGTQAMTGRPLRALEAAGTLPAGPAGDGTMETADGDERAVRPRGRILVVDDEGAIRRPIRRILERRGWRVDEAGDGAEALEMIRAATDEPYGVVLSDLKMPAMSGMELVDRLREDHPEVAERVVIMTGDHVAPGPANFIRRTELPVLEKPFEADILCAAVDRAARGPPS